MTANRRIGTAERFLRLFTDIRPGEAPTALLLMLNIFLIFVAYSIMKVLREVLVLTQAEVQGKALSAGWRRFRCTAPSRRGSRGGA